MVAIVGRPNVGKSTLFNKLAGEPIAIVEDIPGVTRDRHYADAWALGREYVLIDTGGFDPDSDDPMMAGIAAQVQLALDECDVVVCVFDATAEPTNADREAIKLLRNTNKPILYVANKSDSPRQAHMASTYYELGIDSLLNVSSIQNRGLGKLEEAIANALPTGDDDELNPIDQDVPRVAIIGRPNAGKSSLVNALCKDERQLVDDRPGTTMDSVDTLVDHNGQPLVLIDTAGIRRKRSVGKRGLEALSVYQAIRAIERSDVVVLMIDVDAGVGEQDAKIAGLAVDRGRAVVIGLNKIDLLDNDDRKEKMDRTRDVLAFLSWAPMVTLSAKKGTGMNALVERIVDAVAEHKKRITTGQLNKFFEEVLGTHPPPSMNNRPVRLYFITQALVAPPTFFISTNEPKAVHFSYQRYVINQIRKRFGFRGTPIRVRYRGKKRSVDQ
ncbi:MAG: ribosome biogenesis GTPase Der [Polyangiales bacterium]